MTAVELYFAATIVAGTIWIFVPGPVGTRALLVFRILTRDTRGRIDIELSADPNQRTPPGLRGHGALPP